MSTGPSAPRSRQPLSDRADDGIDGLSVSNVPLTKQDNQRLRQECVYDGLAGARPVDTATGIERFDSWYREGRDTAIVVENELGERTGFRTPNRFTPEYREMLYAKAQSLERGLRERWGRLLHTAMVTLTASSTDEEGRPIPIVDHLLELLESWEAVRRALARVLGGRDWEYLAILEPHESGYAHIHLGVFVKGPVVAEQFQSVLDAHVRNCDLAGREAHQVFDEDGEEHAVSVHRTASRPEDEGLENLGAYLAAYMAGQYGAEATEMPAHVRAFYAALWNTGRQWFRPSNGAQEFMQPDENGDESGVLEESWELVGVAPEGDLDDVIEVDPEDAAQSSPYRCTRFEDWPGPPDDSDGCTRSQTGLDRY